MSDRTKVMIETKGISWSPVWVGRGVDKVYPIKTLIPEKLLTAEA
jgi:hypothetical protein